ncbi:MAG: hypothetical protein O2887_00035 [Bacteroidetes bacterium]|nr:hypothetical protein [Bacteroidota bacterium]MDA1118879.1 hypothetical protein [Bacteroidota bacterium]
MIEISNQSPIESLGLTTLAIQVALILSLLASGRKGSQMSVYLFTGMALVIVISKQFNLEECDISTFSQKNEESMLFIVI